MSLQGTLKTLGIAEVLEFLATRSSTGRLDIEAQAGGATYWMLRGEVAEVIYDFERESGTDAAEATYYALSEVEGTFLFDEDEAPDSTVETESVADVLARTAVTAEGWSDVEKVVPSPDHQLTRSDHLDGSVTIEPAWWNAIQAMGDGSTTRKLSEALELRSLDMSRMVADMARNGLILVDEPRVDEPAAEEVVQEPVVEDVVENTPVAEAPIEESVAEVLPMNDAVATPEMAPVEAAPVAEVPEGFEPIVMEHEAQVHDAPVHAEPEVHTSPLAATEPSPFDTPAMQPEHAADGQDFEAMTAEVEQSPVDTLASIAEALAAEGPRTLPEEQAAAPVAPAAPAASPFDAPVANPFETEAAPAAPSPWDNAPPVGEHAAPASPNAWPEAPANGAAPAIAWESPAADDGTTGWTDDDDDDGWATDHSTLAVPSPAAEAGAQHAPAPADPFTQVSSPADAFADAAPVDQMQPSQAEPDQPAPPTAAAPAEPEPDYGTDDRSSVLKFLRRD
ncbi:MAG: DUF4388 domain-containing protein [Acidimicrobiales bacterium]|nr:MAG: DUF4388 domain-containing protein [Acidimicrobiales bacterium]